MSQTPTLAMSIQCFMGGPDSNKTRKMENILRIGQEEVKPTSFSDHITDLCRESKQAKNDRKTNQLIE